MERNHPSIPTTGCSRRMANPYLEPWSRDYLMVGNANIREWNYQEAHMDAGLYNALVQRIGEPIVGMVEGIEYKFKPSTEVLSQECAVPNSYNDSDPTLLIRR